jgi:hypothetical protein
MWFCEFARRQSLQVLCQLRLAQAGGLFLGASALSQISSNF